MTDVPGAVTEFERLIEAGDGEECNIRLAALLESWGYDNSSRAVANLRSMVPLFPLPLLSLITRAALSAPSADEALNGLERISSEVPREELVRVCDDRAELPRLLTVCGSSPFLVSIIRRHPAHFRRLFIEKRIELKGSYHESLAGLRATVSDETSYRELCSLLRRFKYGEILRIAARDLNGLAPLEEVTGELSDLASISLQIAFEVCRRLLVREHGVPMMRTDAGEEEADLVVLGMGKLGGRELNFSSDIDLIYFYSSDDGETAGVTSRDGATAGKVSLHVFFVKLAEMITKAISQVTEDGFVFRVDLGLRPEGKSGDMALSIRSAEIYYESWGQSWERSAMLKAWPVAGSIDLGEEFLRMIEPFVYRKYLDYTLIEDMMAMKKKIDLSLARDRGGELNIKLGRGGIREIEFFIQALQLVFAGKNPALRLRSSLQALRALRDTHVISEGDCDALCEAYRFLRTVEHRIQMVQERQTHNLPSSGKEMRLLARRSGFLGEDGAERFLETLEMHRSKVSSIYGDLFLSRDRRKEELPPELFVILDPNAEPDYVKDLLAERGFEDVDAAYENLLLLRDGAPRSHLPPRGRRLREELVPILFREVVSTPDPDMALSNLERFLRAVGPRSSFYALLAENMEILGLLVSLFGMSDFLSKIFILNPGLLDTMVTSSFTPVKGRDEMEAELDALLAQAGDFEERLDVLRRYRHEEFLRIGMHDIYGRLDQSGIAGQLTNLAEASLAAACSIASGELSGYGVPTWTGSNGMELPARMAVIGMGKLGGRELNYHSDLDIIYVYDFQGFTNGTRRISNREYFAKLGQKIISILSIPTREGYAYKIDTRLRPSGNAGPLVTTLESFRSYHRDEAMVWERQALTKARVILGEEELRDGIESVIKDAVYGVRADEAERREIRRLRMRMEHELARESAGSYNIKTGRGGMVDVEFLVQYLQLRHGRDVPAICCVTTLDALEAARSSLLLSEEDYLSLRDGYQFLRHLENRLRIIHDYSMNDLGGSRGYLNRLARRLGYDERLRNPGEALMADYERITESIRLVFDRFLGEGAV